LIESEEVGELLGALIRNRCVNDGTPESGFEIRSVETLEAYFGSAGEVIEPMPGRASTVYRVPGKDPKAPKLLLMGHLDVVPVSEEGWSVDPFAAEVIDGFIWGRGTVDMLNLTAAMAAVFKAYLTGERPQPQGDLIYFGVADEEAGGKHGAQWIINNRFDLVECDYVLTEVAFPSLTAEDGTTVYPVKVGEKGPFWRTFRSSGTPSHGSQPYGTDNAVAKLGAAIAAIAQSEGPVDITPEWRAFVEGVGLSAERTAALLDPDLLDDEIASIAIDDPVFARWVHACTHLTLSPNMMRGGTKMNTVADSAEASVDIRLLPGQTEVVLDDHLRKVLGPGYEELVIEATQQFEASASATQGPMWEAILAGFESMTGGRRVVPALTPVATDARFFRSRGIGAYGVGMFDDQVRFSDFLSMFHGNNERVSVASLGLTALLLDHIIEALSDSSAR
jgi:acetylornithine deacetylase/succinyl-diaminopimelate desuccinylase-like protein